MLAPITHVLPATTIRRTRLLPSRGRVLVRTKQKVNANDIIAESRGEGKHIIINVRRSLGLNSIKEAEELIEHHIGDKIQKGDVIAQQGRIIHKVVRAPADGEIMAITNGQILLEMATPSSPLKAGYSGIVTEIIPELGAVIETNGALVQGIWGNNQVEQGLLMILARSSDEIITRDRLDASMRGSVIVAGHCANPEVLTMANEIPLRGMILGSMKSELIPLANSMDIPLIILDGFGQTPIDSAAYRLLTTNEKREVCLNATNWNHFSGERPEIIIPIPGEGRLPKETTEFKLNQLTRIQGAPFNGQVGTLVRIRPGLTTLPNGLHVPAADIHLENNEIVSIPLANLDVLE
jgi:hypothetical protein